MPPQPTHCIPAPPSRRKALKRAPRSRNRCSRCHPGTRAGAGSTQNSLQEDIQASQLRPLQRRQPSLPQNRSRCRKHPNQSPRRRPNVALPPLQRVPVVAPEPEPVQEAPKPVSKKASKRSTAAVAETPAVVTPKPEPVQEAPKPVSKKTSKGARRLRRTSWRLVSQSLSRRKRRPRQRERRSPKRLLSSPHPRLLPRDQTLRRNPQSRHRPDLPPGARPPRKPFWSRQSSANCKRSLVLQAC